MKLKLIAVTAALIAAAGISVSAQTPIKIEVNGNEVEFDTPPVVVNDRTMIPIRAVAEAMGLKVSWDGETKTARIQSSELSVFLTEGSDTMIKGEVSQQLDTAPMIINDRTCLPVRAVAEAFGAEVGWNGEEKLVSIKAPECNKLINYKGAFKSDSLSYYYDDSLPNAEENNKTAVLSAVAALAANDEQNIKKFEENNGFTDIQSYNYDKDSNDKSGYSHKSDFTLAKKDINGTNVISVVIRGTAGNEWYSNFDIYESTDKPSESHYGFRTAAEEIYNKLKDYANNESFVWISGHSRGGAVAGELGRMLAADKIKFAAYTFAAPNTTVNPDTSLPIYNYCRENDVIAHIPCWDYRHCGKDIQLNAIDNKKFEELTGTEYKSLSSSDDVIKYFETLAANPNEYYDKKYNNLTMYEYFQNCIVPMLTGTSYSGLKMMFDSAYGNLTSFFVMHSGGETLKKYGISITGDDDGNGIRFEHCIEAYISSLRED